MAKYEKVIWKKTHTPDKPYALWVYECVPILPCSSWHVFHFMCTRLAFLCLQYAFGYNCCCCSSSYLFCNFAFFASNFWREKNKSATRICNHIFFSHPFFHTKISRPIQRSTHTHTHTQRKNIISVLSWKYLKISMVGGHHVYNVFLLNVYIKNTIFIQLKTDA